MTPLAPSAPTPAGSPPPDAPSPGSPSPGTRPAAALADLLDGNRRFVSRNPEHGHDVSAAAATSDAQNPHAFVIGCIDSRVPLEAIFDQTFGAICVARSGGQVLDRALLGSVEFAVGALNVPLVMVLGHERCGAIAATIEAVRSGQRPGGALAYLVDEIAPAVTAAGSEGPDAQGQALRRHVIATVARLAANEVVAAAVATGDVAVVGAVYDLDTGQVTLLC
jgi:carbonic anhydrase